MLHEKALSKKQQRFFGIVRASQKGTLKGEASPQVQRAAASMKKKDVKKFASTKHKGLPEKKITKEETCGKGEYYCNDDQKCKPIPKGMKVEKDGYLVKKENVMLTYKSGQGVDASVGGRSVRNTISNVKKAGETIKNIKNDGLVAGVKKTFNKDTPIKKSVNDKVGDAISQYKLNMGEGSLHKWFKGSKSKDGKGGWVNVKTGGTCASDEPGEGTPKCVSSSKRASMSKAERESASRRKKAADPNQQQKSGAAKPTYVSTDKPKKKMKESFATNKYKDMAKRDAELKRKEDLKVKSKKESVEIEEAKYEKGASNYGKASIRNKRAYGYGGNAKSPEERGAAITRRKDEHMGRRGVKKGNKYAPDKYKPTVIGRDEDNDKYRKGKNMKKESVFTSLVFTIGEAKVDKIDPKNKRNRRNVAKFGPQTKPYDPPTKEMKTSMGKFMQKTRQDLHDKKRGVKTKVKEDHVPLTGDAQKEYEKLVKMAKDKNLDMKKRQGADAAITQGGHKSVLNNSVQYEESDKKGKGSGSKDACYHKVKSRYSVWPSAYASGALVKCRKVGAANWGNSSKKEDYGNISFQDFIYEKCWKGYEKKGMKTMFGKRYPNCVKKEEADLPVDECWKTHKKVGMKMKGGKMVPDCRPKNEAVETEKKPKKAMDAGARGRRLLKRREYQAKVSEFVPKELEDHVVYENDALIGGINKAAKFVQTNNNPIVKAVRKVFQVKGGKNYPTKKEYQNQIQKNSYEPESQVLEASAAWQKKSGKNSKGGLNEKGRKSYEAQNPGSDLKAPVTGKVKKGGKAAKRRKSFCARMGGMKGPMKKPNGKPTRKALALRKWKC